MASACLIWSCAVSVLICKCSLASTYYQTLHLADAVDPQVEPLLRLVVLQTAVLLRRELCARAGVGLVCFLLRSVEALDGAL